MTAYEQIQQMLASRPGATVGLDEVLVTARLRERPARLPDYQTENQGLTALAQELATAPQNVLQKLCEVALELCHAHSAGISIEEEVEGTRIFRWRALAGEMASYLQGVMPRDFAPCGVVVDRNAAQLFTRLILHYPYVQVIEPPISEVLLIPFRIEGAPVGTVWVVSSREERQFDCEDERLLTNLSQFAAAGYQALLAQCALRATTQALEEKNREIEELNGRLRRSVTETHHRVKNNLQLISALIDLQTGPADETVPMSEFVRLGANVRALGVIHEVLTEDSKTDAQDGISVKAVLEQLLSMLQQTLGIDHDLTYCIDDVRLPGRKVTSLALVTNELFSNAIKHGRGLAEMRFTAQDGQAKLEAYDNGAGFPLDFDAATAAHTGLSLIETISSYDLKGNVTYANRAEGGAHITVQFPLS